MIWSSPYETLVLTVDWCLDEESGDFLCWFLKGEVWLFLRDILGLASLTEFNLLLALFFDVFLINIIKSVML